MKHFTLVCAAVLTVFAMAEANAAGTVQPKTKVRPTKTVLLYPKGQNTDQGIVENGKAITLGPGESNGFTGYEKIDANGNMSIISDSARIDIYLPKRPNGQMVVCTPGGGYGFVSTFNEGAYVADWMLKQGISVCVVKYRLPNGHWSIPLTDVQNAFRYCRAHAEEWGIKKIGIIGFSAGGHLAASASTLFVDDITRPDFSILIYPVITMEDGITHKGTHNNLIGKQSKWLDGTLPYNKYQENKAEYGRLMARYSLELQITDRTPVTFIALSSNDDIVPPLNSIRYYMSLLKHNVSATMQIYPYGKHGWGFTTSEFGNDGLGNYRESFFNTLKTWLKEQE
jgi:acetyl esterase/lipase